MRLNILALPLAQWRSDGMAFHSRRSGRTRAYVCVSDIFIASLVLALCKRNKFLRSLNTGNCINNTNGVLRLSLSKESSQNNNAVFLHLNCFVCIRNTE
jgi:hypothetical protein